MAIALILSAAPAANALARLDISMRETAASPVPVPSLAELQAGTPSGRSLPLLHAVASGLTSTVELDYLPPLSLRIGVTPCR
jgi:hypothetical protein